MDSPWAVCAERGPWQGKGSKCLARSQKRAAALARSCHLINHASVFPVGLWFTANREVLRASDMVHGCETDARAAVYACERGKARVARGWFDSACWRLAQVVDPEAKRLLEKAFILGQQKDL